MTAAEELKLWRKARRAELLAARAGLSLEEHQRRSRRVLDWLDAAFHRRLRGTVGCYWPLGGEIDIVPFAEVLLARGARIALPVVVAMRQPLLFRPWTPGDAMEPGVHGTTHPAAGAPVQPEVLLVPLVGFDRAGYRLGYGGGFYDRTLLAASPRPLTLGLGFEVLRMETIFPQPYDIPLDAIVTEAGVWRREPAPDTLGAHAPKS